MVGRRASLLLALWLSAASIPAPAANATIDAPNVVPITARLVTSGQPTAEALSKLSAQGFGAVIYLAPPTVPDAVPGEAEIVQKQGLSFLNIPIHFGKPTDADFQAFVVAMNGLKNVKVLVHCQVNMRASTMTFLYRVIEGHEKPEQAYEAVAAVWSPAGPWKQLIADELRRQSIAFEPY
jgi:protein tyrosine phosphatase (PTP) superfamily phosphohydrolase (DUF442 family)